MQTEQAAFDENWYLSNYADVASAFAAGDLRSPVNHFNKYGSSEGRLPAPPAGHYKRVITYGAYGSNNVGDEAILEGVRSFYPGCVQLHIIKPRNGVSFDYNIPKKECFFRKGDYLILGGGGLLYGRPTVELMTAYAERALEAGAKVDILRIGCEAAHESYYDAIRKLFSLVNFASVRSSISRNIIRDITGNNVGVLPDFAMQLKDRVGKAKGSGHASIPTIGLVLATIDKASLERIAKIITPYIRHSSKKKIKFQFIPHSRSFFEPTNNDCVTAEMLWSLVASGDMDDNLFEVTPFSADPLEVLEKYRKLDGIISLRYHGLIFGSITELPTLALGGSQIKIRSFTEDNQSPSLFVAQDASDFPQKLAEFYDFVMNRL